MKNIYKILLFIAFSFIMWIFSLQTHASHWYWYVNTNTFILNNWNDLWQIIPKWVYFTPRIPYTDYKAVSNKFIKEINYPWDFYSKRNITAELAKGDNKYFEIQWNRPYYISSLPWIKKVLKWFLFAYRKNWSIFWMDAQNFTPAFLTWYKNPEKQSIIIYPIRDRKTSEIKAFVQYPCWNLVCKDTLCTDLKVTPTCWDGVFNPEIWEKCDYNDPKTRRWCTQQCTYKKLTCSIKSSREEILNTQNPYVSIKKDMYVDISKVYLNRKEYKTVSEINRNKLAPWTYSLNAVGVNKYSGKEFLCSSSTFTVKWKEFCWDGVVNLNEECDYKDPNNNWTCSTTCHFKSEACSISSNVYRLDSAKIFKDIIWVQYPKTTQLTKITVNGNSINPSTYTFNKNWKYNIIATITNPYSHKSHTCSKTLTYSKKEFCWDGMINWYETCDDWNTNNWDWCNSYCKLENPICKISKKSYTLLEWQDYRSQIQLAYTWNFNIAVINKQDYFSSENSFLDSKVKANKCSIRNSLEYTVSNKLDPTLTKTCSLSYNVKNIEFCWDGIINANEQCDTEDPLTWPFCNSSCNFKTPVQCHLLSNTIKQWEYGSLVIDADYFATPYKAIIDGHSITSKNGIFKVKMNKAWTYSMQVQMQNKLDTRHLNDTTCDFNLVVSPNICKQ